MVSNEQVQMRGRLALAEKTLNTVSSGIDVDIDELRMLVNKHIPKNELQPERIKTVSDRLVKEITKYKGLSGQVESLKQDLGEE